MNNLPTSPTCTLPSNWTPYSKDTKPKKEEHYLVTYRDKMVGFLYFSDGSFSCGQDKDIIAWMEKPEPYNPKDQKSPWMPMEVAYPAKQIDVIVTGKGKVYSSWISKANPDNTAWMYFPEPYKPEVLVPQVANIDNNQWIGIINAKIHELDRLIQEQQGINKALEALADPIKTWTYVNEKQPERDGYYAVVLRFGNVYTVAYYVADKKQWSKNVRCWRENV